MAKEKKSWVISQKWSNLLFLNFSLPAKVIQDKLPPPLKVDTFEGKAYISIVPFMMSSIRFPYTPPLPFSKLLELNIRTYVQLEGVPGIYFFTLDTNHKLASYIAQRFFSLPYRHTSLTAKCQAKQLYYSSPHFEVRAMIKERKEKTTFDHWIVERYHLFTQKKSSLLQGTALHPPWSLHEVDLTYQDNGFLHSFDLDTAVFSNAYAADALDVKFKAFSAPLTQC